MSNIVKYESNPGLRSAIDSAEVFIASGFFQDLKRASQGAVKILAGRELGFGEFASLKGIDFVKGNLSLRANLQATLVRKSGKYDYRIDTLTNEKCVITFYRTKNGEIIKDDPVGTEEFTMDDARTAGYLRNETYKKTPKNMLFARCMSNGVRFHVPEVLNGNVTYDEYEYEVINGDGDTKPVAAKEPEPEPEPQATEPDAPDADEAELVEQGEIEAESNVADLKKPEEPPEDEDDDSEPRTVSSTIKIKMVTQVRKATADKTAAFQIETAGGDFLLTPDAVIAKEAQKAADHDTQVNVTCVQKGSKYVIVNWEVKEAA